MGNFTLFFSLLVILFINNSLASVSGGVSLGVAEWKQAVDAEKQGANAIVNMRFGTSMVMQNAAEVLAYGTGVVLE